MLSAVIIVGGRGTRLAPVTCNVPKPLVRILDKPFLYYSAVKISKTTNW